VLALCPPGRIVSTSPGWISLAGNPATEAIRRLVSTAFTWPICEPGCEALQDSSTPATADSLTGGTDTVALGGPPCWHPANNPPASINVTARFETMMISAQLS
jgi:hypothetical protein